MKIIHALAKSKLFILLLLLLPALSIVGLILTDQLGANPVEKLLLETGEKAILVFVISLWFTPARIIFPKSKLVKLLQRHRRWFGVSCFIYAIFHLSIYTLDRDIPYGILEDLTRPFIYMGALGFLILFCLAFTSTNWAVKKMGGKRWKKLHRLVYVAAILLCLHMAIKGKGNYIKTAFFFAPMALVQSYRLKNHLASKKVIKQTSLAS